MRKRKTSRATKRPAPAKRKADPAAKAKPRKPRTSSAMLPNERAIQCSHVNWVRKVADIFQDEFNSIARLKLKLEILKT